MKINRKRESGTRQDVPPAFHIREVRGDPRLIYAEVPEALAEARDRGQAFFWHRELAAYLQPFLKNSPWAATVLDRTARGWLGSRGLSEWWERSWPWQEYADYRRPEYAQFLLRKGMERAIADQPGKAKEPDGQERPDGAADGRSFGRQSGLKRRDCPVHAYVLGYEEYVPALLASYFSEIKTLTFVECGPNAHLAEYVERLYEEEGLAASCRLLAEGQPYRTMEILWQLPAVVLDLSGDERLVPSGDGQGIFWIDLDAREAKRRRLEARCSRLTYFSMKEEWRSGSLTIDTVPENGYNSILNTLWK